MFPVHQFLIQTYLSFVSFLISNFDLDFQDFLSVVFDFVVHSFWFSISKYSHPSIRFTPPEFSYLFSTHSTSTSLIVIFLSNYLQIPIFSLTFWYSSTIHYWFLTIFYSEHLFPLLLNNDYFSFLDIFYRIYLFQFLIIYFILIGLLLLNSIFHFRFWLFLISFRCFFWVVFCLFCFIFRSFNSTFLIWKCLKNYQRIYKPCLPLFGSCCLINLIGRWRFEYLFSLVYYL